MSIDIRTAPSLTTRRPRLLLWSGADERAAQQARTALAAGLDSPERVLRRGGPGPVRGAVVTTVAGAARDLADAPSSPARPGGPRPLALLLPGQGSQHAGMATALYRDEPVFRHAVDDVLDRWLPEGAAMREDWLGDSPAVCIDDVRRAQPLLFAVDHGLGQLLLSWGVVPSALLGHSAGEVAAATLAGVFTVAEAVDLVRGRVTAAVPIPSGGMIAVAAGEVELAPYLAGQVAVAAVNAGRQTMLAGPQDQLDAVAARLEADGVTLRVVPATTPFHSPAMEPAVAVAEAGFRAAPRAPRLPVWSGYTARPLTAQDAGSARFWARQIADPVRFGPALTALLDEGDRLLVEVGPGQTLTAFARRQRAVRTGASAVLPMLPGGATGDGTAVLGVAAALWLEGHDVTVS